MAQQARQALTIAPRYTKPQSFGGTDVAWRVLCDLYPSAETPEVVLAVVEYCAARKLDPLRRPVHVVPMWNAKLRKRVQVVMQGINELETTAHRTGLWAGMDMPVWGEIERRRFQGEFENEDGSTRTTEIEIEFPSWCAVTVYRLVAGERRAFSEPVYWIEAYGRAGFRSAVPNARWTQAPRQMLHKTAKAAALRAAFPEEVGYSADEMEDREIDSGGVTIEGRADHGDPGLTDRDRRLAETPPPPPPDEATGGLEVLGEPNGTRWLKNLTGLLAAVTDLGQLELIQRHPNVEATLARDAKTPTLIRQNIVAQFKAAHDRILAQIAAPATENVHWPDPAGELIAEINEMDLNTLNGLAANPEWQARVRDVSEFPPDEDRLNEAIALRRAMLQREGRT